MKGVIAKARLWLSLEEERAEGPQARPDPCIWEEACLPGKVWAPLPAQQSTGPTCKDVSGPQDGNVLTRAITTAIIPHDSNLHR